MRRPIWEFAQVRATREAGDRGLSLLHLTLHGMVHPLAFFAVFNAVAWAGLTLLGHPVVGLAAFVGFCAIDSVNQHFIRRWLATATANANAQASVSDADERRGFRKIAILSATRFSGYLVPTLALALQGGLPEIVFFTLQACTLAAVAISTGALSRQMFWGFASPVFLALAILTARLFGPAAASAELLSVVSLATLMAMMVEGTNRTITVMHRAFNANVRMIPELEAARDHAVAQQTAANEAREEARQASRAKANFLATMSHEIRTPMNGVLGMAQLLERDETDPKQKERLSILIDSGEYLLSILNDVLDVSKIDAGRLDITPAAEDLHQFLGRLVSFWGAQADEKGVALILDMADSVPHFAMIDALRLRQVLFNLVGNALKFTEAGSVTIAAKAMPNGEGAVLLHISISDTGIGIAPQTLPHLFTRFSQADDSEVRRFGGTGLGLAIAKQLVELMGGRIWADSLLGDGSTFHIKLPLALADRAAETPSSEPTRVAVASPDGLSILAVDDNAVNLLVLDQLLSSMGHKVAKAAGGREALDAMDHEAFDLVLLDIQMPEMTGIEVLQRLRAAGGPNRDAPVVALTADVTSGGRRRYLELGFTEHAAKPIQIAELMAAIGRAMAADPKAARAA
jgi:signal transduction histidine kinase/ActR/RegA family two-component response regulator